MTEMVEDQSAAPAEIAPASGETSAQAPVTQHDDAPVQAAEPEKPEAPGAEGNGDEEGKRPSRSQRLQRKVQLLTQEVDELRRTAVRPQDAAPTLQYPPPREGDFNGDYLAYERALNAWNVEQAAVRAVRQVADAERNARSASHHAELRRERVIAHIERVEDLKDRVSDFDDTMKTAAGINLRDEVAAEILGSEKSALIQYHLAKNPDKARDLNGLTGRELARAVGRLEGAVRLPAAKRATDATPPVHPLTGAASPGFDPFRSDMDQYAANFRARQKAREQRRV
jgi:hypothetical protein